MSPVPPCVFTVRLFGPAQERVGAGEVTIREAEGSTCEDLLRAIGEQHPSLAFALPSARLAVNHALAPSGVRPRPQDEIALIALVDGG